MNEDEIDISSSSSSSSSSSLSPVHVPCGLQDLNQSQVEDELGEEGIVDLVAIESVHQQILKTAGELTLDELPPVEEIDIKAPLEHLEQIGRVLSVMGKLVVVVSFKGKPALDLDSVLFLRDCLPLGKIFDTFGPVVEPYYAIRFNLPEDVVSRGVYVDRPVYFVPQYPPPLTTYVFYKDLQKIKGSDASWKNDNEPPIEYLDFSDDEEERLFKSRRKRKLGQSEQKPVPVDIEESFKEESEEDNDNQIIVESSMEEEEVQDSFSAKIGEESGLINQESIMEEPKQVQGSSSPNCEEKSEIINNGPRIENENHDQVELRRISLENQHALVSYDQSIEEEKENSPMDET